MKRFSTYFDEHGTLLVKGLPGSCGESILNCHWGDAVNVNDPRRVIGCEEAELDAAQVTVISMGVYNPRIKVPTS